MPFTVSHCNITLLSLSSNLMLHLRHFTLSNWHFFIPWAAFHYFTLTHCFSVTLRCLSFSHYIVNTFQCLLLSHRALSLFPNSHCYILVTLLSLVVTLSVFTAAFCHITLVSFQCLSFHRHTICSFATFFHCHITLVSL